MINMQKTINKIIISNIKKYRYKNNLSQNKLKELSGLEINKIENNKKIISTKELLILSNIFKININSLFKIESIEHTIISINENIQIIDLQNNLTFVKNLFKYINYKKTVIKGTLLFKTLVINDSLTTNMIKKLCSTNINIKDL